MDTNVEVKSDSEDKNLKLNTNDDGVKSKVDYQNEPVSKKPKLSNKEKNDDDDDDDEEALSTDKPKTPPGFTYPLEMDASDMLDDFEFVGDFPTPTQRYFTPYYAIDVLKPGDDICIRVHSNRICMISLAPSHLIFEENKKIVSCNYKVSEKLDRSKNKVTGKGKHGAQPIQGNSNLCCLTCDDGSSYMVKCCMIGKLIEVNLNLIDNPELLRKEPHHGGYIALILPNLKHHEKMKESLLNQEQYEEAIKKRKEKKENEGKEKISDMDTEEEKSEKKLEQIVETEAAVKEEQQNGKTSDVELIQAAEKEKHKNECSNMEIVEPKEIQNNVQSTTTDSITLGKKEDPCNQEITTMEMVDT